MATEPDKFQLLPRDTGADSDTTRRLLARLRHECPTSARLIEERLQGLPQHTAPSISVVPQAPQARLEYLLRLAEDHPSVQGAFADYEKAYERDDPLPRVRTARKLVDALTATGLSPNDAAHLQHAAADSFVLAQTRNQQTR